MLGVQITEAPNHVPQTSFATIRSR